MIEKIKHILKNKLKDSFTRRCLKKGYHMYKNVKNRVLTSSYEKNEVKFNKAMNTLIARENFSIMVIGANDGVRADPLHPFLLAHKNIKSVFIEPQKKIFTLLKKNLSHLPNARFENCAIDKKSRIRKLYKLKESAITEKWHEGLASFTPSKNALSGFSKSQIETEKVHTKSISQLIKKHKLNSLTYLQVDTEGYDFEILKMINFSLVKPAIIRFERININPFDTTKYRRLLQNQGYELEMTHMDCIAYLNTIK